MDPEAQRAQEAAEREEKLKYQMQVEAKKLRDFCEREEQDFHTFLMEREKINYFWIVEKKTLTEKQADLRNKEREYQDLEERQQIELKMFQQRLKHLRYHQQDEVVELKTDSEVTLKLQEDHDRITEAEIKKDKRALKVEMKEAEVGQEDFIRMLKLEQDQKILELRQEFDRRARDMQQKYDLRMKTIRDEMEKQRRKQIQKIEEPKNTHIQRVMQKNKQLKDPLKRAHADVEQLELQLQAYEEDKKKLAAVKEKIRQSETMLHRMEFQHEVLQQQLERVTKERDELYTKFQHAIYDVQQKSGLKNLILEKKIDSIEEALETTEAQVSELLTSANVDQATASGISQKLDQVIAYKDNIVAQLQEEVHRIKDSHRTMVSTYESKLAEYGIPPEELGFQPLID